MLLLLFDVAFSTRLDSLGTPAGVGTKIVAVSGEEQRTKLST